MILRRWIPALLASFLGAGAVLAAAVPYFSILDFPTPYDVVRVFSAANLASYGITGSGYSIAGTTVSGNIDAPINGQSIAVSNSASAATFSFSQPRYYVGISVHDADHTVDVPAPVVLEVYGPGDQFVGSVQKILLPSNSLQETNRCAIFLGIETDLPFTVVRIRTLVSQTTVFDNLVFERVPGSTSGQPNQR